MKREWRLLTGAAGRPVPPACRFTRPGLDAAASGLAAQAVRAAKEGRWGDVKTAAEILREFVDRLAKPEAA